MATWLSLVNLTRLECGVTTTELTTLANLTGKDLQIKNWVNRAWMDVQRVRTDWLWMRKSFSFVTVANQATYTPTEAGVTDLGEWLPSTFRTRITAQGYNTEQFLEQCGWDYYRNTYGFGSQISVTGRPTVFTVQPNSSLTFWAKPDAATYTVTGDYAAKATAFAAEDEVPAMPDQFVDIIMHKAKIYYGQEEAASEVFQAGSVDYARMLTDLLHDQSPSIDFGGALA